MSTSLIESYPMPYSVVLEKQEAPNNNPEIVTGLKYIRGHNARVALQKGVNQLLLRFRGNTGEAYKPWNSGQRDSIRGYKCDDRNKVFSSSCCSVASVCGVVA